MICGSCGKALLGATARRRFCSDSCRSAAWRKRREDAARKEGRDQALAQARVVLEEAQDRLGGREE